jgi:hypothetical protein
LNPLSKVILAEDGAGDRPTVMDIFDGKVVFRQPLEDEALISVS